MGRIFALLDSPFLSRLGNLRTLGGVVGLGVVVVIATVLLLGKWWVPTLVAALWLAFAVLVYVSWRRDRSALPGVLAVGDAAIAAIEPPGHGASTVLDAEALEGPQLDALRHKLGELRDLDVREHVDPVSGLPLLPEDPLLASARAIWNLLRAERMPESARAFYGEFGPASGEPNFDRAFRDETAGTSREAYRERRVRLLQRILRERRV